MGGILLFIIAYYQLMLKIAPYIRHPSLMTVPLEAGWFTKVPFCPTKSRQTV
jgi:hypothetical protein